jgi:hypothetical protein
MCQGAPGSLHCGEQRPGFLADAKRLGLGVSPLDGQEMLRRIDRLANAPHDLLDYLKEMRQKSK